MTRIFVLGAGLVGRVIAQDLITSGFDVVSCDISDRALEDVSRRTDAKAQTRRIDLSDADAIGDCVTDADLVVGALPSRFGFEALRAVIEAGKPYADISFMPEDPLELHSLAVSRGVCAVVDAGVAPGLSHMLAARAATDLNPCRAIEIYVGGLPVSRTYPYQYKAGFSPADVLEEYTRPARLVEHHEIVTRDALTEIEHLEFDGVGTLEAFNTDGLRSLLTTLDVPFMKEKTLRYPGHADLMRVLRETGLMSQDSVPVGDHEVRTLDLLSALLFPKWTFDKGEADVTVMRVTGIGEAGDRREWDLIDRYDEATDASSMSRTTGYTCTGIARLLADGRFSEAGVHPPERLDLAGRLLDDVLAHLGERGVRLEAR